MRVPLFESLHAFQSTCRGIALLALLLALPPHLQAQGPAVAGERPAIQWNDNELPAGVLEDGRLSVKLEVRRGQWRPLGEDGGAATVLAFAEAGRPPQIPGPMVRVPRGTEVVALLRNPLDAPLEVQGLSSPRTPGMRTVTIEPGEEREVRFVAEAAGTYMYRARLEDSPTAVEPFEDNLLAGAIIVDDPGAPRPEHEKVMVIQLWSGLETPGGGPELGQEFLNINGRPWPHTERLSYGLGDTIDWRVINASGAPHPMHLHGFLFEVRSRGDLSRDTVYWPEQERRGVTERMDPWTTMRVTWSPDRPGGWIFHCHLTIHVLPNPKVGGERTLLGLIRTLARGEREMSDPDRHALTGMGGLVVGIEVRPPDDWTPERAAGEPVRLYVHKDSTPDYPLPRFGFVLQEGERPPAPDSMLFPGPPLVLHQGAPAAVRVMNRTGEPTQIHWHGLEVESYFDGVAGVTGREGRRTPAILPGDSFDVTLRTNRPGTYIYHTHMSDVRQQGSGLYGPLIILPEGTEWDPGTDRVFIIGNGLAHQKELAPAVYLNGSREPDSVQMRAGTRYRIRLINITLAGGGLQFRLLRDRMPVRWTPLAHDAWDLPAYQTEPVEAERTVSVGETYDYAFTPEDSGELRLEVRRANGELAVEQVIQVLPPPPPAPEEQIAAAVQAAPEERREQATVLGYDPEGELVTLREGENDMICLANAPGEEAWSVACYHESLEPYMERGRELRAQGVTGGEVNQIRWAEVEEGTLPLPDGTILYVLHGEGWDSEDDEVRNPYLRWVIYRPFATPEETGLPVRQRKPGEPWLMFPGTAGAHIMVTPPRQGG